MNCLLIWSCIQRFPREVMCSTFQKVKIRFGDILKPARPFEKQRRKPPRGAKIREQRDSLRRSGETRSVANVRIFATRRGDAGTNANTPQNLRGVANDALRRRMEPVARFVRSTKCDGIAHFAASGLRAKFTQGAKSRQRKVRIRSRRKGNPADYSGVLWSWWADSNRRPIHYE